MSRRKSFLLTVISAEGTHHDLCGQVKVIATGETSTFNGIEELEALLLQEPRDEQQSSELPSSAVAKPGKTAAQFN